MKLEKFDLEKALNGAKVVTRDGREVTQLTKFDTYDKFCLYGLVDEQVYGWSVKGEYSDHKSCSMNLYIVGEVNRAWVNIYRSERSVIFASWSFDTMEEAMRNISEDHRYIKTIEITDEL